jgi:hypothetical protein
MSQSTQPSWSKGGENILSQEKLDAVRNHLADVGNIVVEHWHFYGSRAPTPLAFDDYDVFDAYLRKEVRPGDAIDVYPFSRETKKITAGKFPDGEGRVPTGGAY